MPLQGACLCSKIKISVDDSALPLTWANCFCNNCHTTAGSPFSSVAPSHVDKIKIDGKPNVYEDSATDSGNTIQRHFCSDCGTPVMSTTADGAAYLKVGIFSQSLDHIDAPGIEVFTAQREKRFAWVKPVDNAKEM